MSAIAERWQATQRRITGVTLRVNRDPRAVLLLAVSKTFPAEAVVEAAHAGARCFGENYVQEGVDKIIAIREAASSDPVLNDLQWHFIGPLQSNKTRLVAEHFDWVQSIDRLKIAERLSAQRPAHLAPLQVCVQVNISGEASKSGVPPEAAVALCAAVAQLPHLQLRGLMAIPEPHAEQPAAPFAALRDLLVQCNQSAGLAMDTLSMGMSVDCEMAIAEGATIVRIGTAIFGERSVAA